MTSVRKAQIAGMGSALPSNRVPNEWFETKVDTNDEWIRDRTGISSRRFAEPGTNTSDLSAEAARLTDWLDGQVIATVYPSPGMKAARSSSPAGRVRSPGA